MKLLKLIFSALFLAGACPSSLASTSKCEENDGSCPDCSSYPGDLNFNAFTRLSPSLPLGISALKTDAHIREIGSVQSFVPPFTFLHMTLFYFCCQDDSGVKAIVEGLKGMKWQKLVVLLDSFGCNIAKDNETIYLHAMPSMQSPLFALTTQMQKAITSAGGRVNHPRTSLFHVTLARASPSFPADAAVDQISCTSFGDFILSKFSVFVPRKFLWYSFSATDAGGS